MGGIVAITGAVMRAVIGRDTGVDPQGERIQNGMDSTREPTGRGTAGIAMETIDGIATGIEVRITETADERVIEETGIVIKETEI